VNTPAHVVVNLAVLGGGTRQRHWREIVGGALLCDVPMLVFFVWESFIEGATQAEMWGRLYFMEGWQAFFDLFNSIPLAGAGLLLALVARRTGPALLFASVLLHAALDFPLHHDDGHRHFWPFSEWRFASPVSYWDPRHHGAWGALLESLLVVGACAVLWARVERRWLRAGLAALAALQMAAWCALYVFGGLPTDLPTSPHEAPGAASLREGSPAG